MTEPAKQEAKPQQDLTGRKDLVSNVLFSWGSHLVFIVAGFIMPRMIDQQLGQDLLGVWDFAWSLVGYFSLVQMGINSSVNRYVAKYRAADDVASVNCVVSSTFCLLGGAGGIVAVMAWILSSLLPQLFGPRLGENVAQAQSVVFFLGVSIACEIASSAFSGVLTGCHHWALHNALKSGWYAVTVAGMMVVLSLGQTLSTLAVLYCVGQALMGLSRMLFAYRVCAGLQVRPSLVRRSTIRNVFAYGAKTLIPTVSDLLLNQTTAILIVSYVGPAALALFARPKSLIRHVNTLISKMAFVLTPTASSLQSSGDVAEIGRLLLKSARYSCYMALPIVVTLIIFGGPIMGLWMGPNYADGFLPAIMAAGYLVMMVNCPLMGILAGLNAHGRAGVAQFVGSVCSVGLAVLALKYTHWGLIGVALAVTLPLTAINTLYLPRLICRRIGLKLSQFYLSVLLEPMLHVLPFAACLVFARVLCPHRPLSGLGWGGGFGAVILGIIYWHRVLPTKVTSHCERFFRWARTV